MKNTTRKAGLAATGLILSAFLIHHLLAALLIFLNPGTLNRFAYHLNRTPLILLAEISLGLIAGIHIFLGVYRFKENKSPKLISGLFIALVTFVHVVQFKGIEQVDLEQVGSVRDVERKITTTFQSMAWVLFHSAMALPVGIHLKGSLESSFARLFKSDPLSSLSMRRIDQLFVLSVSGGYFLMPILCWLKKGVE